MKEKGFWTRPRPYLDIGYKVAVAITIVLVREWRYTLVLLCSGGIGALIALFMRSRQGKDHPLTITGIQSEKTTREQSLVEW
jgi:hypothetical protein